jgi:hypothetical protein
MVSLLFFNFHCRKPRYIPAKKQGQQGKELQNAPDCGGSTSARKSMGEE